MKNTPLRVMLFAPGHSIHSQRFLGWLQNAGLQILFVDAVSPPNLNPRTTRYAPYRNLTWSASNNPKREIAALLLRSYLRLLTAAFRPDVVHVHQINRRAAECARAGLQPLVLTAWGSDINGFTAATQSPGTTQMRYALSHAAHLFADSTQVIERAQQLAGHPVPASLMFFGIDTARFRAQPAKRITKWRAQWGISADTRLLLSIRGWKSLYQHEEILRAFAAALPNLPFRAVLLFKPYPPGSTAYEANLRTLADTLGIAAHIRFLPPIPDDDMPALYHLADAIVNYPREDGFPVSFLEAAASGCPIVTVDLPVYHANGLENYLVLVPPGNLAALAEGICTVLNTQRTIYSKNLYNWAVQHADQRHALEDLLQIYTQLAQR